MTQPASNSNASRLLRVLELAVATLDYNQDPAITLQHPDNVSHFYNRHQSSPAGCWIWSGKDGAYQSIQSTEGLRLVAGIGDVSAVRA